MRKLYDGYATPGLVRVRYYLDWSCASCRSENVTIDPSDLRELKWCDGGPSTEDQMRYWICHDCGAKALGYDMMTSKEDHNLTDEEMNQERIQQRIAFEEFKQFLDALERGPQKTDE